MKSLRLPFLLMLAGIAAVLGQLPDVELAEEQLKDERQKVEHYTEAQKAYHKTRARLKALKVGIAAVEATDPDSPHLEVLRVMVNEHQAEVTEREETVADLKVRYRIIDLADLPPEERKNVIMVD